MRTFRTLAVLALVTLTGCGSEEDHYTLVRVSGTVSRNGKPLADASVSFVPASGNAVSTPGVDQTGPDGNYLLMFRGRTGVAPGKYKVFVTPPADVPAGTKVPEEMEKTPGMFQMGLDAKAGKGARKSGIAEAKKDVVKSEFEAEVDANVKSQILDFNVKSK